MAITTKAEGGPITGGGLGGCYRGSISGQYPATDPDGRQLTNAEVFDLTGAAGGYRTYDLSLTKIEVQPQTLDFARVRDPKTAEHTANSPLFPANIRPRNRPLDIRRLQIAQITTRAQRRPWYRHGHPVLAATLTGLAGALVILGILFL